LIHFQINNRSSSQNEEETNLRKKKSELSFIEAEQKAKIFSIPLLLFSRRYFKLSEQNNLIFNFHVTQKQKKGGGNR
jgi:hypothetical protein